ncbi:hypothetical protein T03_12221 [Trichinella britovi]|uniref:Uncharacterized protein n=1 Tax=Trichinella britovi TaxID=45882 RepID=A0A0V1CS94_TRIBR|nr:hypothetical protein T03_12221 [Trichinella britovi]
MPNPLIYIKNRWKQRTTNYKWGPVPERHTATLGDDVNDYEALKADLKKMFIPLKSEMSLHAVLSSESATWRTSRHFCYQSPRGGREGPKYQTVLMDVLEKEPTTMDEARRITLKTALIEEASYSMDFRNNYPYDRGMEQLTAALFWLISRLDDRLPNRGDNSSRYQL